MIKQFFKPTSIEEALLIKEKFGDRITWFAGGTRFNHISFQARFDKVIALEGLGLHSIHSKNEEITVGATVTLQKLADNSLIPKPLRLAALNGATRTIRNMATVGGDIASGAVNSALAPCLIALKARVVTADKRSVDLEEFVQSGNKDLIVKICLPIETGKCWVAQYQTKANAKSLIKVATQLEVNDSKKVVSAIIAIGSIEGSYPRRLRKVEEMIVNAENLDQDALANRIAEVVNPVEDIHGSISFKKYIAGITVADCIFNCLEKE